MAAYPLAGLRTGARLRYEVAANWKVILENYNECYHCGPVHPELCELVPAFRRGGGDLDWAAGIPHRPGATTFTSTGTTRRAPFPGLSEAERTRHFGELVLPNLMLSLSADHVAAFTVWPRSAGQTTVLCDFLFHPDELARPDFDPSDAVGFWDLVNRQDWSICEQVQDGMGSRRFSVGYLAPMEQPSADIGRYVAARLDTGGPAPAGGLTCPGPQFCCAPCSAMVITPMACAWVMPRSAAMSWAARRSSSVSGPSARPTRIAWARNHSRASGVSCPATWFSAARAAWPGWPRS